jgi:hypothetical protein
MIDPRKDEQKQANLAGHQLERLVGDEGLEPPTLSV